MRSHGSRLSANSRSWILLFCCLLFAACFRQGIAECVITRDMATLELSMLPNNDSVPHSLLLPLGEFGRRPPFQWQDAHNLVSASPLNACQALDTPVADAIVLARRGNCTFLQKAENAAAGKAKALVVVNDQEGCLDLGLAAEEDGQSVKDVILLSMTKVTGDMLFGALEQQREMKATIKSQRMHAMGFASVVLLVLAVVTISAGSLWSGRDYSLKLSGHNQPRQQMQTPSTGQETVELNTTMVVSFVAVATLMMFVMFFLLNKYTFYIILGIFAWGSFVATATTCQAALVHWQPTLKSRRTGLPYLQEVTADWVLAVLPSLALVLVWVVNRRASWAWVPQNILGMNFMILAIRTIQLPSASVASLFLGLLFFYDIFMVFITPLFMPHGESVMIRVAQGGSANEIMPMLLVIPRFFSPMPGTTMLGYGDIVVPGLLLALLRRFDVALSLPVARSYFLPAVVCYVIGLLMTYAALEFEIGGSHGQPALLYLVPCTLGTTLVLATWRHELGMLWRGEINDDKDSGSDLELGDDGVADTATSGRRPQIGEADDINDTARLL